MKFKDLQERLRILLRARFNSGELTGSSLARQIGLKQAHVSNFIRNRRGLSIAATDAILDALQLSALDLIDPEELNRRVTLIERPSAGAFENVMIVSSTTAARQAVITSENVIDVLKFKKSFLRRLRSDRVRRRANWRRFIAFRVDEFSGSGMLPKLQPGATVLVDRHYNSLTPYREGYRNMYAVLWLNSAAVRFVEVREGFMMLIPLNPGYRTEAVEIEAGKTVEDYIVGRVAQVSMET